MSNNRLERINEDVARALSSLVRNIKDPRVNQGLISVTGASVTNDLKHCTVYLSCLGLSDEKEFFKGLKSASGYLRHELSAMVQLRETPQLTFALDKSIEHGARINAVLAGLDIQPEIVENDEEEDEI